MQIVNLSFDNGEGTLTVNEAKGLVTIVMSEKNPSYPGGAQFNIPLDPIMQALIAKQSNVLAKWGLELVEKAIDL